MRVQFHFWPAESGADFDAWDVARLIELADGLPVERVDVESITELDTDYWTDGTPSPRSVAVHARFVRDVDPRFPILLGPDGRLLDGMHRVVLALMDGRTEIEARRFPTLPDPDLRNVRIADVLG